jgi:hypothetical protein
MELCAHPILQKIQITVPYLNHPGLYRFLAFGVILTSFIIYYFVAPGLPRIGEI